MGEQERLEEFADYAAARQSHLKRTAFLLCGDWHEAQDLTQTALLNLCKAWHRAKRADSIDAYAQKTLINAFLGGRRKRSRERAAQAAVAVTTSPFAREDQPDLRLALLAGLAALPPRGRAVVVLRFWADFSIEDTAAALGCSTGNVKSHSSRALAKLRELLGDSLADFEYTREGGQR
ncbi:SigE family RNA polymerase sigma factor [Catenulispora pinisilvae]|uniref:SigE family RNA polymerase sigma factor n=1 Tax=Catenulispora pinisilvae TaxID=2705253 RepID=UPI0018912045|nr:SigE family RNA polymerase sigma factor [Catenulispora pinisilvae]